MAVIILSSQSHEMRKIIKSKKTEKRCPNFKFKKIKNVKITKNVFFFKLKKILTERSGQKLLRKGTNSMIFFRNVFKKYI